MRNRSPFQINNYHSGSKKSSKDAIINSRSHLNLGQFNTSLSSKPTKKQRNETIKFGHADSFSSSSSTSATTTTTSVRRSGKYNDKQESRDRIYFRCLLLVIGMTVVVLRYRSKFTSLTHPFIRIQRRMTSSSNSMVNAANDIKVKLNTNPPDAIIIGSGLAGLSAAINILDRGGTIVLIEKNSYIGGNSNKACSGINACCHTSTAMNNNEDSTTTTLDSMELFRHDTTKSAGTLARPLLIEPLIQNSGSIVAWLQHRVGVDLSLLAQLGGHSVARTHRPTASMVGIEIIYKLQKLIRAYETSGKATILLNTRVTKLLWKDNKMDGVVCQLSDPDNGPKETLSIEIHAPNIILATGGFASDRSDTSYIKQYRPDLMNMPTTAGLFSTGDGITLAQQLLLSDGGEASSVSSIGPVSLVDMEQVQIHPTGFVDPADPASTSKTLAAELLRGVGGILVNSQGRRFCNELGTRDYISGKMLEHDKNEFFLILTSSAASNAKKHIALYQNQGLIEQVFGKRELAKRMNLPENVVETTLQQYYNDVQSGKPDQFGKTFFHGIPYIIDFHTEAFYIGVVTPVVHYCMGGLEIDPNGHVLDIHGNNIPGLFAAGEVTGGVHGKNRLGGNSLLECAVFGSLIGRQIPMTSYDNNDDFLRIILPTELELHNTHDDCWVVIDGIVYDLTSIAKTHPGGPEQIYNFAGKDATTVFMTMHASGVVDRVSLKNKRVGVLLIDEGTTNVNDDDNKVLPIMKLSELSKHNTPSDCWVAIHGTVYDLTNFADKHPGGVKIIHKAAGTDATKFFSTVHNQAILNALHDKRVAVLQTDDSNDESSQKVTSNVDEKSGIENIISLEELSRHKNHDDCWVAVNGFVYDVTEFAEYHRGGAYQIYKHAGEDISKVFNVIHRSFTISTFKHLIVGTLEASVVDQA